MRTFALRAAAAAAILAAAGVTGAFVVWEPALVSFALAVVAAICWASWLDRHPEA
jgi:hypothetical protein